MLDYFISIFAPYFSALKIGWGYIGAVWWLWLPILLLLLFERFLIVWRQNLFKKSIAWALLEIKIPREIKKSPKAMEQIFANLYGTRNQPDNIVEKYVEGEVTRWYSFEIASFSGEIHFYVRTPVGSLAIVEANIYANYPEVEITRVEEDYINRFPETISGMYEDDYKFFGSEIILDKDDVYPIRTYADFEGATDEKSLDPVSSLLEVLNRLKPGENILMQLLMRPAHPRWREEGLKVVEKIRKKAEQAVIPTAEGARPAFRFRSPGEEKILKAIEENLMKPAFETTIRYVYIAKKNIFDMTFARRGVLSAFNQYSSFALNRFRQNFKVWTLVWWVYFPYLFAGTRQETRKKRIWKKYREREMPHETFAGEFITSTPLSFNFGSDYSVLNIEELATIYHLPSYLVLTAPLVKRIESRKMAPPVGLAIFSEEKEIKL